MTKQILNFINKKSTYQKIGAFMGQRILMSLHKFPLTIIINQKKTFVNKKIYLKIFKKLKTLKYSPKHTF